MNPRAVPVLLGAICLGAAVWAAWRWDTDPIADLYHAPGTTAGDQATLVFLWQATQGMLDALLVTGLLLLPIGLLTLGVAMLGTPDFGRGYGWVSVTLGVAGVAAAVTLLVDVSEIAVVVILALIVFHLALGWKVYSLSRATQEASKIG